MKHSYGKMLKKPKAVWKWVQYQLYQICCMYSNEWHWPRPRKTIYILHSVYEEQAWKIWIFNSSIFKLLQNYLWSWIPLEMKQEYPTHRNCLDWSITLEAWVFLGFSCGFSVHSATIARAKTKSSSFIFMNEWKRTLHYHDLTMYFLVHRSVYVWITRYLLNLDSPLSKLYTIYYKLCFKNILVLAV